MLGFINVNKQKGVSSTFVVNRIKRLFKCSVEDAYGNYEETREVSVINSLRPVMGVPDFVLPENLTRIDENAFEGIQARIVYIPDSCTFIDRYAFLDSNVSEIRIPENCALGDDVFEGCEEVTIFGTLGSAAAEYCEFYDNCIFLEE